VIQDYITPQAQKVKIIKTGYSISSLHESKPIKTNQSTSRLKAAKSIEKQGIPEITKISM